LPEKSLATKRKAQTPTLISACINTLPETVALEQEAIPHAVIPKGTNHFLVVKIPGESLFDLACFIEGFQLFDGELKIQTGEIVFELRYLPRSNDGDYRHRLIAQPRERDLGHAASNAVSMAAAWGCTNKIVFEA
jgi:hypothetical protein